MEHSDIEHMAQGYPPSHIGKDHEEVVTELAMQLITAQQKLDAVVAERDSLREFFVTGIRQAFDGCHFDGGEMQDLAMQLGLLREQAYDPEKHHDLVPDPTIFDSGDVVCLLYFQTGGVA